MSLGLIEDLIQRRWPQNVLLIVFLVVGVILLGLFGE